MCTGIILAGGKSSRVKCNKPFIKINEEYLIEIIIKKLNIIFKKIIIVTSDDNEIKKFNSFTSDKISVISDIYKNKNSLGGIYTGLHHSKSKYNFITACDMPFLNIELINYLVEQKKYKKTDIIIPEINSHLEPLYALYSKSCLTKIEKQIENNNLKIIDLIKKVRCFTVKENIIKNFDPELKSFFNLNTDKDLQKLKHLLKPGNLSCINDKKSEKQSTR